MRVLAPRLKCVLPAFVVLIGSAASVWAQQDSARVQPEIRALLNTSLPASIGQRAEATQYMMIDVFDIALEGDSDEAGAGAPDFEALPEGESWYVGFDDAGDPVVFSGPNPDATNPGPTRHVRTARQEVGFRGFLRSLGESTGKAFQLQMESSGPIRFDGTGIVVEPLVIRDQARAALEQEITQLAARNPITRVLNAYCLEFLKEPPSLNQVFRIAEEQVQQLYAPAANILQAARTLVNDGFFEDDPLDYVHSIKQWAIWAHEGNFTFSDFSERFLAHAQDNFTVAGLAWTEQIAALVTTSVDERWGDIGDVLGEAGIPLRSDSDR